jgi:coenzyme F420-reducing hydrogenase beta subunit
MKNIKGFKDCYGCGVCAIVCSRKAITIQLNESGFYVPVLDSSLCTNCGLCAEVCAFNNDVKALDKCNIKAYGAWSNNSHVRNRCSSGGVGYELGRYLIKEGYKVCAVKYNTEKQRAEHYIAKDENELMLSVGSKYIQSYTVDAFKSINRKEKYLVTGTPCQIDSFRRYIRKFKVEDNFVLMDFFCHSVPSMLAWKKYVQFVEEKVGPIVYASWRNKFTGWHDSWAMAMDGAKSVADAADSNEFYDICVPEKKHSYNSRLSEGDIFYKLFLGDYCCNPACQKNCKYKYDSSSADIRIGDFWGQTYVNDEEGVSAVAAFTEKGNRILNLLDCTLIAHSFETVAEGQMKNNAKKAYVASLILKALKDEKTSEATISRLFKIESILRLPSRIINKLYRMLWIKK